MYRCVGVYVLVRVREYDTKCGNIIICHYFRIETERTGAKGTKCAC